MKGFMEYLNATIIQMKLSYVKNKFHDNFMKQINCELAQNGQVPLVNSAEIGIFTKDLLTKGAR